MDWWTDFWMTRFPMPSPYYLLLIPNI
jgi:hypothetical protein